MHYSRSIVLFLSFCVLSACQSVTENHYNYPLYAQIVELAFPSEDVRISPVVASVMIRPGQDAGTSDLIIDFDASDSKFISSFSYYLIESFQLLVSDVQFLSGSSLRNGYYDGELTWKEHNSTEKGDLSFSQLYLEGGVGVGESLTLTGQLFNKSYSFRFSRFSTEKPSTENIYDGIIVEGYTGISRTFLNRSGHHVTVQEGNSFEDDYQPICILEDGEEYSYFPAAEEWDIPGYSIIRVLFSDGKYLDSIKTASPLEYESLAYSFDYDHSLFVDNGNLGVIRKTHVTYTISPDLYDLADYPD